MNFRCSYQLGLKTITSNIEVSGQDESFDAEESGKNSYLNKLYYQKKM